MSTTPNDTFIARVQALLDKAESTTFPEEADALLAKAQELMARHAIDQAMLAGVVATPDEVEARSLVVLAPYASAKVGLLAAVASANRCRVVVAKGPKGTQHCTLVGYGTDLDNVHTLFASLSFQAVRFMLEAPVPPGEGVRGFRHAFLLSYGQRISERLKAAGRSAESAAEGERSGRGGASVALVLSTREAAVEHEVQRRFPRLRNRTVSMSSASGYRSGRRAADRASLGGRQLGAQRSLGSG